MWEPRSSSPLGRLSVRNFLAVATALLVAIFGYILISSSPLYALPAQDDTSQTTPPDTQPEDAERNSSEPTDAQAPAEVEADSEKSSCKVDGVGWLVCSASRWIADGVDYLYSVLTNFFLFQPLSTSGPGNSIYSLWDAVRNVANVAFIVAFLFLIYAQITNGIVGNYTIKKMLPRVVLAAILVNISFWICALGIDLSNILGQSIQDLFVGMRGSLGAANTVDLPSWADVTAGILSGTGLLLGGGVLLAATGGTVGGLAFLLLGALIPVIFAALVAVAVLAARQALITLLVIIAPLAFVAYVLPNTEEWFTRWRKFFMMLLIMFPAFSLIFGASQLAGVIIIQNAKDISVALLGLTVQVVPLFITPFLIKLSSGVLGTIAGLANNKSRGVFDRARNWTNANREMHRQRGFSTRSNRRGDVFRPTSMARRLNHRRLNREGATAAHQAMAEARFQETAAGRRIHDRKKTADLTRGAADASNLLAYNQATFGIPGVADSGSVHRRALHRQAHVESGEAKLIEDGATARAESAFRDHVLADRALRKTVVETHEFKKRGETAEAAVQSRAEAHWNHLANADAGIRNLRLDQQATSQAAKRAEEQWNTIIANIQAVGGAAPSLQAGEGRLADAIRKSAEDISVESYAKANAETEKQERLTKTLLEDTRIIDGKQIREYAGGIREGGSDSVLAAAVAQSRKQFGEKIGEKAELIKHFNLDSTKRQTLAMGSNVTATKDGVTYVFEASDPYARDAVVDTQLATGSFSQIKEIIDAAVPGGATFDYRTTISQAVATKGLDSKAFFWGAKSIDDLSQGLYSEPQAIKEHLLGDKVKPDKLAVQDVYSLRMAFEAASNPAVTSLLGGPAERAKFAENYEAMRRSADLILSTPELSKSLNHEAREILERYRSSS